MQNTDPIRDLPPRREYPLQNGNVVIAEKDSEFGFWHLHLKTGLLPERFKGSYSTIEEVQKAVLQYSTYRDIALGPQPPRPQIKYKDVPASRA